MSALPRVLEREPGIVGLKARFGEEEVADLNARFDRSSPQEILRWAAEQFGDGLVMTSSFGADAMCTIHLATRVAREIRVIVVNTGFLFPETLNFMEEMRLRFGLNIVEYRSKHEPLVWLTVNGESDPKVRKNVNACCAANKNEVFDRAMREIAPLAWVRGVRAEQSAERSRMKVLQWNARNSCWALSPILRWTNREVFDYMKQNELPHHPLWAKGYTSIGCSPETCTRAVGDGEDARSGRWAGMEKKECGIHLEIASDI